MWIRLRQVALVAQDLEATVSALHGTFGLEVAYRDPGVATFGLQNAVLPIGTQFLEVVSPTKPGTAGGRHLERHGGDAGYMVIAHTDDHPAQKARVADLGVRTVVEFDEGAYHCLQLHPSDTGGSFLEIDHQEGGEDPNGPWMPAGPHWQDAVRTHVVTGIAGVEVAACDPHKVATRWAEITDLPLTDADGTPVLGMDNATVRFVPAAAGRPDALTAVQLIAAEPGSAPPATTIGGVRFFF